MRLREFLTTWLVARIAELQAASTVGIPQEGATKCEHSADPDFEGWLRNDPMVTAGCASRYRSQPPGYLTSNGRGSLEVGAVDDSRESHF